MSHECFSKALFYDNVCRTPPASYGDPDTDFARGMIPHHQDAIDMAKIAVAFGKDPEIRKLAEEIVKAQETEIDFMRSWLRKHGQ